MSATSSKVPGQKLSKHKINPGPDPAVANYVIRFDLYEAAEIKSKAKLAIELAVGSSRYESKKISIEVTRYGKMELRNIRMVMQCFIRVWMILWYRCQRKKIKFLIFSWM